MSTISSLLIREETVALAVLDTTALVNEAIVRHRLTPVAAAALGRTFTAGAYLCSWLKTERSVLTISLNGGGAGGKISVSGDSDLSMRGFIEHPDVSLPPRGDGKLDVGRCVGKEGTLSVVRDDGDRIPFVGTCALVSGEIAEDLSAYFLTSEQRPTAVALGVLIGEDGTCLSAGGVFLQPLPGAGEGATSFCENEIGRFSRVSALLLEKGARGIVEEFTKDEPVVRPIRFRCRCSRKRAENAVLTLGREEALKAAGEEGGLKVTCRDCSREYLFTEEDVLRLFGAEA